MRKLLLVLLRQANNDRGNAVAIVLLVLAVTSLIGVGMLTQSRIDLKFVTSLKSHSTAFNLADSAATLALASLSFTTTPQYEGQAVPTMLRSYNNPVNLAGKGTYWPLLIFHGPVTNPTRIPGYEVNEFALECWTAQGSGKRRDTAGLAATTATNADLRKSLTLPSETSVQIAKLRAVHK
jgi:hypothetical protein